MMDLGAIHATSASRTCLPIRILIWSIFARPPICMKRWPVAALRAGKHVLVEKAIALEIAQADAMVAAAARAGKLLMVAHVLPFFPEFAFAHQVVTSGQYGKLLGGHFKRIISQPDWSGDFATPASPAAGPWTCTFTIPTSSAWSPVFRSVSSPPASSTRMAPWRT